MSATAQDRPVEDCPKRLLAPIATAIILSSRVRSTPG